MPNGFNISLNVENIGPHYGNHKLDFSDVVSTNKTVIYASNGTGKSFISRAFRLSTTLDENKNADELLSLGYENGHFVFCSGNNKLEVSIKLGEIPIVKRNGDLLFHVFNSDYVEENVKPNNFNPDGNIEGYIIGKTQIDITEEKDRLSKLCEEINKENIIIDESIETAKLFLRNCGVSAKTKEYVDITKENVKNGFNYSKRKDVIEYVEDLNRLSKIPENLPDISFSYVQFDLSYLEQAKSILSTQYPKSEWDEEFVEEYKSNKNFIELGLSRERSDKFCPFCKREYNAEALDLINKYNQYRNEKETQIVGILQDILQKNSNIIAKIDNERNHILEATVQLDKIKSFFPSLSEVNLLNMDYYEDYKTKFQLLENEIKKKIDNLNIQIVNIDDIICDCKNACNEISVLHKNNEESVNQVNKKKNDVNSERLFIRKNLCISKSIELQKELKANNDSISIKTMKSNNLIEKINNKENQAKTFKRDKVYLTLERLLDLYFYGKYKLDKESFNIQFLGENIKDKATNILSDGEKSILAFCLYLAETHVIVNSEDDYGKLFFVIDDPISSMDFQYVYVTSQIIRSLKDIIRIPNNERVWVFTHNIEFFSILMRNKVLSRSYLMQPGIIKRYKHELLMPYEHHLIDLYEISEGQKQPNHTTGNSIRQVIETISRFEKPGVNLEEYVKCEEVLSQNYCIFSMCNDLSHGNYTREYPFNEVILVEAAKTVINFVENRYSGQIESIKNS